MAGLIELVKGDSNKLKGKCFIYSNLLTQSIGTFQPKEGIVAVYFTNSVNDFKRKIQSGLEEIAKQEQQSICGAFHVSAIEGKTFNFYMGFIPAISEESILNSHHDVVYVGKYSNEASCKESTWFGAQLYLRKLIEQRVQDKEFGQSFREKPGYKTTYKDFKNAGELEKHIYDHYISVMTYANEGGDVKFLEDAKDNFTQFMAGYLVRSDITDLFKAIENGNKNLVEKYVKKIAAVSTEQYKAAAEFKKEIKEMTKPDSL